MSKDTFNEWYERHHKAGKLWIERRAVSEEEGLKKFYRLKEQFKELSKKQKL